MAMENKSQQIGKMMVLMTARMDLTKIFTIGLIMMVDIVNGFQRIPGGSASILKRMKTGTVCGTTARTTM